MERFPLTTEQYRRIQYNRRKKPWRSARAIRAALGRRNRLPRLILCGMIAFEAVVIGLRDPAVLREAARLMEAGAAKSTAVESEALRENEAGSSGKSESGVTIDLKEGKVEFWRTEETVRSEGAKPE